MSETVTPPAPESTTSSPDVDVSSPESADKAEIGAVQWQILEQFVENDSERYEGKTPTILVNSLENDAWKFEQGRRHNPDQVDVEPILSKESWDELFDIARGDRVEEFEGLEGLDFVDALRGAYNEEHGIVDPVELNDDLLDVESDPDIDAVIDFLGGVEKGDDPIAAVEKFKSENERSWERFSDDERAEFADMVRSKTSGEDETIEDSGTKIRDRIDFNEQIRLRSEFPQFDDIEDPEDRQEIINLYVELEESRKKLQKSSRKASNYIMSRDGYRKSKKEHMKSFRGYMSAASKYRDVIPGLHVNVDKLRPEQREAYEKMSPEEERNAFITRAVVQEVYALESLRAEAAKESKFDKFIGYWNSKGKWTKFGIGAAASIAVVTGAGVVAGAGMIGGAAAVVAAGGTARFARGAINKLTYKDIDAGKSAAFIDQKINDSHIFNPDNFNMYETIDIDVKERRKANRRAVAWGAGSALVGASVALGFEYVADHAVSAGNDLIDNINDWADGGESTSYGGAVEGQGMFEQYPNPMHKVGAWGYTEDDAYAEFIEKGLLTPEQAHDVVYEGATIAEAAGEEVVESAGIIDVDTEGYDGVDDAGNSYESNETVSFSAEQVNGGLEDLISVDTTDPAKTAEILVRDSSLTSSEFLQLGMDTFEDQTGVEVAYTSGNIDPFSFGSEGYSYKSAEFINLTGIVDAKKTLNEILIEIATQNMR